MPAARDERDVVAGVREARAEVAADAARSHHRDTHGCLTLGVSIKGRTVR